MDLSTLSDEDLRRLANNDYTKLSDDAKTMFKAQPTQPAGEQATTTAPMPQGQMSAGPVEPSMLSQAGDFAMENIVTPAVGAVQTAAQYGMSNPIPAIGTAVAAAKYGAVKNLATEGINNWRNQNLTNMAESIRKGERFGQDMSQMKNVFQQQQAQQAERLAAQQAAQSQPSMIQRATDMASRMRQAAANRVVGFGASGAAVPAAVGAGGAAATGIAGGQLRAMTPEQRRALYDNEMLGAMGGDASLAAAIMNRGQ